jgi:hypothetical protein
MKKTCETCIYLGEEGPESPHRVCFALPPVPAVIVDIDNGVAKERWTTKCSIACIHYRNADKPDDVDPDEMEVG